MLEGIEILLVEDNPADVDLTRQVFQGIGVTSRIHAVSDGAECLDFLRRRGSYAGAPRPHLIVLDLNLPGMDGCEALSRIKRDPDLGRIPVLVFSSSESESDVLSAYELHANCYIAKPVDFDQLTRIVRAIEEFWLTLVTLPRA